MLPEGVKLNINDYNLTQTYVDQVNDLTERGCRIDIMGCQRHLFKSSQSLDIAAGKVPGGRAVFPDKIWGWADNLAKAGKLLHISEITLTAPGNDERGRMIQAIIARNFYRIWFSIKPMMGITWWNVVDDCGAPGEPTTSGLFDRDVQPKPSFYALDQLINHEWKTSFTEKAPKDGVIRFRGFKGQYRITYKDRKGKIVISYM